MGEEMRIHQPIIRTLKRGYEIVANIENCGGQSDNLFFRVRAIKGNAGLGPPVESIEPFVAATYLSSLIERQFFEADGKIDCYFYDNLKKLATIYHKWDSKFAAIDLKVQTERITHAGRFVGCFFSGGVDSFYTVLKNLDHATKENRITHLIFVHGFDIALEDTYLCETILARIVEVARDLHLGVILVRTNLRKPFLHNTNIPWGAYLHGAGLAAAGLALSTFFRRIYIASTFPGRKLRTPLGSHPATDPLWSTNSLTFVHDGLEATRHEKMVRMSSMDRFHVCMNHLRVCLVNPDNAYNCSECEKCLRTMMSLHLAGVFEDSKTFSPLLDNCSKLYVPEIVMSDWQEFLKASILQKDMSTSITIAGVLIRSYLKNLAQKVRRRLRAYFSRPCTYGSWPFRAFWVALSRLLK
jgi:hypothetical protein